MSESIGLKALSTPQMSQLKQIRVWKLILSQLNLTLEVFMIFWTVLSGGYAGKTRIKFGMGIAPSWTVHLHLMIQVILRGPQGYVH